MALNKFKEGVAYKEQEDRNEKRLCEVSIRLEGRAMKRTYEAIKKYAIKSRAQRVYLKTMLNRLEKFNKEQAMRRWKDSNFNYNVNMQF